MGDGAGIGRLIDGSILDRAAIERLFCDSGIHRVLKKGRSAILDYGTTTRSTPASLFNAIALRDGHCRFPGCDRPPEWSEAHHVIPVEEGGPTSLSNEVLACSRHHHEWHRNRWKLTLHPDGELHMLDPNGRLWITRPPP